MHKIGIIRNPKDDFPEYTDMLKKYNFTIEFLPINFSEVNLADFDAYIIEEMGSLRTCEIILKLRKETSNLIWLVSEETFKVNNLVYLQLGIDGTTNIQNEKEEFALQLSNLLSRLTTKVEKPVTEENHSLVLIPNNLSVIKNGESEISLTPLEFKILNLLFMNRGETVSYKKIYQTIWGTEKKNQLYRVNNLIFNLRKKLGGSSDELYIRTIRSKGYLLSD